MGRETLAQIAKMTLAAVAAWAVAEQIHPPQSFIAPYVAVFVISETVYRSLIQIGRQLVVVVVGIVLAFGAAAVIPHIGAAMAVAVFVGMLIGQWQRLGDSGVWVGTIALLMLAYGTADNPAYLYYRLLESLVGVSIGAIVNILVLPPIRQRQAHRVVNDLSRRLIELLCEMAEGLRHDWDHDAARAWQRRCRSLHREARVAEDSVRQNQESTKFNLRWLYGRKPRRPTSQLSYVAAVDMLGDVNTELHRITDALVTATDSQVAEAVPDLEFNRSVAELLDDLAASLERYRQPLRPRDEPRDFAIRRGARRANALRRELAVTDGGDALSVQGMLVLAFNRAFHRLRTENQDA